ncbi:AraC family transcriptional regulator [Clostridium botulinum]|uniref:AraC family transcriptional regulator n=1 Tax=Clostridium botulinum TaxID=1491 RepID=UPI0005F980B3|nr:effector binding domain-containing protein [Clostridium botulinum]KOM98648.1 AraC family transcriptional regulator [Clostridium botulinum]KON00104.1 AraC family transcriptional regulator [Clostridium botulinum]MBY7002871.1 AraC family transcriptional regulator [Clostridium botulinum]MCR1146674.1 AraC family transcriptional regulator [Clostridium botulinum]NFH92455.1 AraC family transcriptional regulator [Clostridium botulinum]
MKWLEKLSKAIDYIENNLTGDISYEEAAKIACCSTYYFQRMFSCVTGITLADYIRHRRMTKAAFDLCVGKVKVMDVALKYGYASATAFNRAFRNVHGVTPTAARVEGTILKSYPRISFAIDVIGGESMRYRIETKDPIRIVGVRVALEEDQERNFKIVPKFWDKVIKSNLLKNIGKLVNQNPTGVLGVTVYKSSEEIYYYIGASTDRAVPDKFYEYEIPEATWVIFECDGRFQESIQTIYKRFLTEWLPFSGYKYAELPDIEVYPITNQKLKGGHSEVWIAIEKEDNIKIKE